MALLLESNHVRLIEQVAHHANVRGRKLKIGSYENYPKYNQLAKKRNISAFEKKQLLMKHLYEVLVKTFGLDVTRINKKTALGYFKNNLRILRRLTLKLMDLNYYFETTFLEDLGIAKPRPFLELTQNEKKALLKEEENVLDKKDYDKLDYTVFKLIDKIVFFDKKLLKKYSMKEGKIVKDEKLNASKLKSLYKKQSEFLHHLEAKLPPASHVKTDLFKHETYTHWVSHILSLLVAIVHNHLKEQEIIKRLKKDRQLNAKIGVKISHLINEKWNLLKLKQKRFIAVEDTREIDAEWQKLTHDWSTVQDL